MTEEIIRKNLQAVHDDIIRIAHEAGREPGEIKLVAVSKTVSAETVRQALDAGQQCFGENRVQELQNKAQSLPKSCEWHMIGHLQRNKVKTAIEYAACIHSVDSVRLIERIEKTAAEMGCRPVILLQINMSREESKHGVQPEEAPELLDTALGCGHLECRGFMTMAPFGAAEAELKNVFGGLRTVRDRLSQEFGVPLPELSMGMSSDYETAIREGATMVRIGSAVFGARL